MLAILVSDTAAMTEITRPIALTKKEIAQKQVDAAISLFMRGYNDLVVFSIAAPASQILRDLNKGNDKTISGAITSVLRDLGANPNDCWKEFNSSAAHIKHGSSKQEKMPLSELKSRIPGEIIFCIGEYMLMQGNDNRSVSQHMYAFINYLERKKKRDLGRRIVRFIDFFDRYLTITWVDAKMAFLNASMSFLLSLRDRLQKK